MLAFCLFGSVLPAISQDSARKVPSALAPLEISGTTGKLPINAEDGPHLVDSVGFTVRNSSSLPIRGFVLRIRFFDPISHQFVGQASQSELYVPKNGQPAKFLQAGDSVDIRPMMLPLIETERVAIWTSNVDFVVFRDGTSWGPKRLEKSHELAGTIRGIDLMAK